MAKVIFVVQGHVEPGSGPLGVTLLEELLFRLMQKQAPLEELIEISVHERLVPTDMELPLHCKELIQAMSKEQAIALQEEIESPSHRGTFFQRMRAVLIELRQPEPAPAVPARVPIKQRAVQMWQSIARHFPRRELAQPEAAA